MCFFAQVETHARRRRLRILVRMKEMHSSLGCTTVRHSIIQERKMAKYIFQALVAFSAFAVSFARASGGDDDFDVAPASSLVDNVATETVSTTSNDEKENSTLDLFKKFCMICDDSASDAAIGGTISRGLHLRGAAGSACIFEASSVLANASYCCNDTETGEPWDINDLTAFFVTDPFRSVNREDVASAALVLKDICGDN